MLSGIPASPEIKLRNNISVTYTIPHTTALKKTFTAILALLVFLGVLAAGKGGKNTQIRDKARYYYLEGIRLQVDAKDAEAFEMYKKAYHIDPSYTEAQSAYGARRLTIETDTFQSGEMLLRSLDMMRPFVEQYPGDFFESAYYAYLAAHLDTLKEAIRIYERSDSLFPSKTATLYHLSEAYMADHNLQGAIGALDRYEKVEGKSPEISLRKITYFIQSQDTAGALGEAHDLVDYSPKDPRYRILLGNVHSALGNPDSALNCYLEAERIAPDNGAAKLALAAYYKEIGDSSTYDIKTYEALLSEDFDLSQKAELLAQYLQRIINDKSATSRGDNLFDALQAQYPHEPEVLDLAARYSAAKGDVNDAIEQIGYAIDLSPDKEDYWGQLMSYQLAAEKPTDALRTFDRAATHLKPSESLRLLMAQAAAMSKDYDRAVEVYDSLLKEINPSLSASDSIPDQTIPMKMQYEPLMRASTLYNILGDLFYQAGRDSLAFTAYENSLRFMPDNPIVLNNYAYYLEEEGGDLERAYTMSKRAIEIDPDNPTFIDTYAWILFKRGDYAEALIHQQAAVEKAESAGDISAELYSHFGDILFHNARPDEAVEYWEKALKLSPDDAVLQKKVKTRQWEE